MKWFLKAADEGDADAQANIGAVYHRGRDMPRGYSKAIASAHLRQLAKKNDKRTDTGKNVLKLYFDINNADHKKFRESLSAICASLKKKIERGGEKVVDVKIRGLYDVVDGNRNVCRICNCCETHRKCPRSCLY